jgi:hypothetical protein
MAQEGGNRGPLTEKTKESMKESATKITKMAATTFKLIACPVNFGLVSFLVVVPRTFPRIMPCLLDLKTRYLGAELSATPASPH